MGNFPGYTNQIKVLRNLVPVCCWAWYDRATAIMQQRNIPKRQGGSGSTIHNSTLSSHAAKWR
jgi:hypothetical protein